MKRLPSHLECPRCAPLFLSLSICRCHSTLTRFSFFDLWTLQTVQDFLLECFQKDYRLRCSAKRLLKHPWMMSGLKQLESRRLDYQEGVESVQKFNEELEKTSCAFFPTTFFVFRVDCPYCRLLTQIT